MTTKEQAQEMLERAEKAMDKLLNFMNAPEKRTFPCAPMEQMGADLPELARSYIALPVARGGAGGGAVRGSVGATAKKAATNNENRKD